MILSTYALAFVPSARLRPTAWEVAGEYIYTTPGDQDTDYLMLTLNVDGYR